MLPLRFAADFGLLVKLGMLALAGHVCLLLVDGPALLLGLDLSVSCLASTFRLFPGLW